MYHYVGAVLLINLGQVLQLKKFCVPAVYSNILVRIFLGMAAEGKSYDQWLEKV